MAIHPPPTADEAMQRLMSGNRRFSAGEATHPRQSPQRRLDVAAEQTPFAAILSCSDSRLPPEIIFDQGLGDLYVIRVAGNIADGLVLGSLELAVEALGLRLVVVLGHDQCAAVQRAIHTGSSANVLKTSVWTWQHGYQPVRALPSGHLSQLILSLKPAVDAARSRAGDLTDQAINSNIDRVVEQLRTSRPVIAEYVNTRGLRIVGARYGLTTGAVSFRGAP